MIFSELCDDGIPTWYKVFLGTKTVTTRALDSTTVKQIQKKMETCMHCKKSKDEHTKIDIEFQDHDFIKFQEKDRHKSFLSCKSWAELTREKMITGDAKSLGFTPTPATLAACPSRGKAAICKNCGGWKEWHFVSTKGWRTPAGVTITKNPEGMYFGHEEGVPDFSNPTGVRIVKELSWGGQICDHYEPLWIEVKDVIKRSHFPLGLYLEGRHNEARKEGFSTWEVFDKVKRKLYGEKDTWRIEFSKEASP